MRSNRDESRVETKSITNTCFASFDIDNFQSKADMNEKSRVIH